MVRSLPSGWSVTTLGTCASWYSGGTPRTSVPEYWDGDIPWITASSLHEFQIQDSERRITPLGLENGSRLVPTNSILFVVRGMSLKTEFRVGIARRPVAFGQDCKALVADDNMDPLYLANVLRAKSDTILGLVDEASHGTGRLQTSALERLEIPVPPLGEQRAIACVLGTLDDKIKLNRRTNQTLEETAQAIFKSWFVDFDPVRVKAAGRLPTGLAPRIADLFPQRLEQSKLGLVPEGWAVRPLDEVADYQNGLALQRYPPEGDDFLPVIKIRELRQGKSDENSDKASPDIREDCIIDDGDVIFSWSGSLLVDIWCGGKGALNQHLFKVTSDNYPRWFYYHWTKHHLPEFQRIAADKATTMGHIKRQHLSDAHVVVPPDGVLQTAGEIIEPLIQRIVSNNLQSRALAEVRDALLPKLITGELRMPEMERVSQ